MTPVVETTGGKVRVTRRPHAAGSVGPLRLRRPQPVQPWSGVCEAVHVGAPSLQSQAHAFDTALFGASPQPDQPPPPSEDCLYVNVTPPAAAQGRPVLVWIHLAGDGLSFVRDDGVVVTFNYRLEQHTFRADRYYRLNVFPITIPPRRE